MLGRPMLLSFLSFLLGLGILIGLDILAPQPEGLRYPWLHHLFLHIGSLLGTVGLVGIIFERFFRRKAMEEFVRLFSEHSALAESLSMEERKKRVKDTLIAQLGKPMGTAIFDGLVSRYFSSQTKYREEFRYEVHISDLERDVVVGEGKEQVILSKDNYYSIEVRDFFTRPLPTTDFITLACVWSDDFSELSTWFTEEACVFRETIVLAGQDKDKVSALFLKGGKRDRQKSEDLRKLFTVRELSLDGHSLSATSAEFGVSSAKLTFEVPADLRAKHDPGPVTYRITVSGLIDKETRKYPVILGEPTKDPSITLTSSTQDIARIVAAPFFTGTSAFKPQIEDRSPRRVDISFARTGGDHVWMFPGSGVLFMWERK